MKNDDEPRGMSREDWEESQASAREFWRESDIEHANRPVGKWAPADFVYECPAARREP